MVKTLLDNTQEAYLRSLQLAAEMALPETAADSRYYLYLSREAARLAPFAKAHDALSKAVQALETNEREAKEAGDLLPLYREEREAQQKALQEAVDDAVALTRFLKHDGNAPCVLTVRETPTADFGKDVLRLYARYLDGAGFGYTIEEDKTGGTIRAEGGLGRLRHEAGLHRRDDGAQCTVSVMPQKRAGKVTILPEEIRVDIFCSSGKGGQNVNKVETAVRITHLPTGTVVTCQDERSQLMNKRRALSTLAERLQARQDRENDLCYTLERDKQTRDRSNPVRRYDTAHDLLVDKRTDVAIPLKKAWRGEIDPLLRALALQNDD